MGIDIRPFEGEPRAFFEAGELAFSERLRDEDAEAHASVFEPERAIAAYDGDRIVGTAAIFSFDLSIPGGMAPVAGVTYVGVQPTHRRRGILRRMMNAQLAQVHERGEPIAVLWASEGSIYQRFGYGLGTWTARIEVEQARSAFRRPHAPAGSIRFVDPDEAAHLFPPVYDAVAATRPGFFARSATYWQSAVLRDPEHWRRGASRAFHVVHEVDGAPDGYARYRVREQWDDVGSKSTLVVAEKMATNPQANLDLWRFLLDVDLVQRIEAWNIAPDDPIAAAALEPRRLQLALGDGLWLRVVDVSAALAGRRYAADGRLVVDLSDDFCAWNAGRWSVSVDAGIPLVEPTTDPPELALDVTDLGAVYLGAHSFTRLADAGRVAELQPGALLRADELFRTPRAPWCPRVF